MIFKAIGKDEVTDESERSVKSPGRAMEPSGQDKTRQDQKRPKEMRSTKENQEMASMLEARDE